MKIHRRFIQAGAALALCLGVVAEARSQEPAASPAPTARRTSPYFAVGVGPSPCGSSSSSAGRHRRRAAEPRRARLRGRDRRGSGQRLLILRRGRRLGQPALSVLEPPNRPLVALRNRRRLFTSRRRRWRRRQLRRGHRPLHGRTAGVPVGGPRSLVPKRQQFRESQSGAFLLNDAEGRTPGPRTAASKPESGWATLLRATANRQGPAGKPLRVRPVSGGFSKAAPRPQRWSGAGR